MDDDADDLLGARLDSALRELDMGPVDGTQLLQGSRRRAVQVRRRRTASVAAAAVLVIAAPVAYEVANPRPGGLAAAMLPSGTGQAATDGATPTGRPEPSSVATPRTPAAPVPSDPTYLSASPVPATLGFTGSELPAGLKPARVATASDVLIDGQDCRSAGSTAELPIVSRHWAWGPGSSGIAVGLTVTGWARGEAAQGLTQAINGTGQCRWVDRQTPRPVTGTVGDQRWASTSAVDGEFDARTVIRVGNAIVGVTVRHPRSAATAAGLADELAAIATERVRLQAPDLVR